MNFPVMQSIDLTGASYSAALMCLLATTVMLLIGTSWVEGGWKIPVTLCAVSSLVGAVALYEARLVWLTNAQVPIVYHHVGWLISMPAMVAALYFVARQVGSVSIALFWRLLVVALLMVLFRYFGEAGLVNATLAFLIGLVFWIYILGELFFGQIETAISSNRSSAVKRGFFWVRLIVTVGWAVYPLASFIISFNDYVDTGGMSIVYNVAEFGNSAAFSLAILAIAVLASQEKDNV